MGIHWVAVIFFAAQAAPLAWRGSHAFVWFMCTWEYKSIILSSTDSYAGRRELKELGSAV
jgi:hypothetical protein